MSTPTRRARIRKSIQDTAERRRSARILVAQFRNTSKRIRQLKQGRQGAVVNPMLNLAHDNHLRQLRTTLETMGHRKIARLLGEWHGDLMESRRTGNRELMLQAREISGEINRAIEEIK